jgi:hypothetical protein
MLANVTLDGVGIGSVQADTTPTLGGNLILNTHNISGTGNISITGTISSSDNISSSAGSLSAATYVASPSYQGTALTSPVVLQSSAQEAFKVNTINTDGTGANAPTFTLNSSRGTIGSPTNTAAGDILTSIQFRGYYGGQYVPAVSIRGQWDAGSVLSSAYAGGTFLVATGNNSNAFNTLTFNSKGTLAVSGPVQVGLFATGSYPSSPAKGMIIFDSTTNHFYGYNGTSWVAFTGP